MRLPRYVTRARDVTGPVTRAPCAPGHVSCHALVPLPSPRRLPSLLSTNRLHPFPTRGYRPSLSRRHLFTYPTLLFSLLVPDRRLCAVNSFFLPPSLPPKRSTRDRADSRRVFRLRAVTRGHGTKRNDSSRSRTI